MRHLREIVDTCLRNHPKECLFEENAVDKIMADIEERITDGSSAEEIIDVLEPAIKNREVYCPHEGIDRRGA